LAIQVLLTLKAVFALAYRALEGFAGSLMRLTGLNLPVPDHTQTADVAPRPDLAGGDTPPRALRASPRGGGFDGPEGVRRG